MDFIFVCSEFGGKESNLKRTRKYCKFVKDEGCIPIAPHLIFTQFLNDRNKIERNLGIDMGIELMKKCQEVWVFIKDSVISDGMNLELAWQETLKIPVKVFDVSTGEFIMRNEPGKLDMNGKPYVDHLFDDVAKRLKDGVSYEALQKEVDKILGPLDSTKDENLEGLWEEERRAR